MAKRKDDLLGLIILFLVISGRGFASSPAPALPSAGPSSPPAGRALSPGWWWSWITNEEAPAYQQWWTQHRESFAVRKTYGGPAFGVTVVLIEVFDRVPWPFQRDAYEAPRGADTDLTDVAASLPSPPSVLRQMVEQVAKKVWEVLKHEWETRPGTPGHQPPEPFPWGGGNKP